MENENGLSTLMESAEVPQIFGEDLAFELKALFCDAFGPNLRNVVAHGLLNDDELPSASAVYAWWLCLRITFNTFWNQLKAAEAASSATVNGGPSEVQPPEGPTKGD